MYPIASILRLPLPTMALTPPRRTRQRGVLGSRRAIPARCRQPARSAACASALGASCGGQRDGRALVGGASEGVRPPLLRGVAGLGVRSPPTYTTHPPPSY